VSSTSCCLYMQQAEHLSSTAPSGAVFSRTQKSQGVGRARTTWEQLKRESKG
jgi:hypothetical protein